MRHLLIPLALAALQTSCILSTQFCGKDFVEEDGRCVPLDPPPAYYSDAGFDLGRDAEADRPIVVEPEPIPEPIPDAEPEPQPFDPWADRMMMLVVDRTERGEARDTPTSPGYDLDAVLLIGEFGEVIGFATDWAEAQVNDPFDRSLSEDPAAALGEPNAEGVRRPGNYVSLGTEGGFIFFGLEIWEPPLMRGGQIIVFEMEQDRGDERVEVYLCLEGPLDLGRCLSAGEVRGTGELFLE